MSNSAHWTVGLNIETFASTESDIVGFLSGAGVEGHAAYVSQLVVEEIVRNLIEHTPPYAQEETATVTITVAAHLVTIVIEDQRRPFDPTEAPKLDVDAPLDERRSGGMGLHLVRNMTDELTYEVADDRNRLTAVISRR
ncbi:MAG: ATP-binding protein [Acidimicrobiales bacterium]